VHGKTSSGREVFIAIGTEQVKPGTVRLVAEALVLTEHPQFGERHVTVSAVVAQDRFVRVLHMLHHRTLSSKHLVTPGTVKRLAFTSRTHFRLFSFFVFSLLLSSLLRRSQMTESGKQSLDFI
jgi:hypothetical protein